MRLFVFRVDRMWVCVGTAIRVFECGVGFVLPVGVAGHTSYTSDDDVLLPHALPPRPRARREGTAASGGKIEP